ncbi:uncharacterized protein TM35_000281650 [Trypanosoma theileri]|uniref:Uncharacterized protein n=1 Tax=Trypanosoma theileri TaxID=67003 RepID=A0A1X0NQI5_9TRYP|nr:uncharacterized protein TM35_000281650 [Trypanosoma theileri]ORC86449.1 hypothetical protein TM35_000281650 [Trypanosoma theileri]
MAALNQVALLAAGCSESCTLPVVARSKAIAYCSATSIYMHTPTKHTSTNTNNTDPLRRNSTSVPSAVGNGSGKTFTTYPLSRIFANGVTDLIQSFDFNDEYMACVTRDCKTVVWRVGDAEVLNGKRLPNALSGFFKREGGPMVVRVAGKHHIVYGTTTGWIISANMNDGTTTHQLKLPLDDKSNSIVNNDSSNNYTVGQITSIDASPARPDVLAVGTSEGMLFILSLHPSNGLQRTATLRPFATTTTNTNTNTNMTTTTTLEGSINTGTGNNNNNNNNNSLAAVTVAAFDPNNAFCLAVGSREGALVLVDAASGTVVQRFEVQDSPICSISWIPTQSGTFVTTNGNSSKLSIWTVNSRTSTVVWNPICGSVLVGSASFAPEHLFLALRSGSVAVFNTQTQEVEMQTETGHTNRLHDCRYSKHDKDLIATTSADGTIRVWNTKQLLLNHTIEVGSVIVQTMDWSPSGKYIVAGLSTGEVVSYHVSTQHEQWRALVVAPRYNNHNNNNKGPFGVCGVVWSPSEAGNYIAAAHRSGITLLSSRDGKVIREYTTKSPVYSVDMEPLHAKQMAAACHDGQVYIFSLTGSQTTPTLILTGHTDVVNHVIFNPIIPRYLLSASHDTTLRVWDLAPPAVAQNTSVNARVLRGHTDHVHAAAWCPLAPYIAFSAGADGCVRVWDVRNGVHIAAVRAHSGVHTNNYNYKSQTGRMMMGGVVGLAGPHGDRPLVLATAGGVDGAVVFWHAGLLRQAAIDAALGALPSRLTRDPHTLIDSSKNTNTIMGVNTNVNHQSNSSIYYLAGEAVQQLSRDLADSTLTPHRRMERIANFFEFPYGAVDVARVAAYCSDPTESIHTRCSVVPSTRLVEVREKLGKSMVEKAHGRTVAGAGAAYKKTRLIEAADAMLQIGNITEYCKLMIEAGEWDNAIAAAPLVSREFWRSTCLQAAEAMQTAGDVRATRYFIMAEESARAARFLAHQSDKNWDSAIVIAKTCPQRVEPTATTETPHNTTVDTNGSSAVVVELLEERASMFTYSMNPRIVAAAKLANGANDEAVMQLVYSGDVLMAHLLIHSVPLQQQTTIDAGYRLPMLQSCRQRQWDTAVLCATRMSNAYDGLATVLSFCQQAFGKIKLSSSGSGSNNTPNTNNNINNLSNLPLNEKLKSIHEQILGECRRLQLPLDMESIQQRHANDGLASINQIAAMVLSPNTPVGIVTSEEIIQTMSNFIDNIIQVALQDIDGTNAVFYLKQAYAVTCYVSLPIQLPAGNTGNSSASPGSSLVFPGGNSHSAPVRKFLALSFLLAALMCVKVYRFPKLLNPVFSKACELCNGDTTTMTLLSKVQQVLNAYSPHSIEVNCTVLGEEVPFLHFDNYPPPPPPPTATTTTTTTNTTNTNTNNSNSNNNTNTGSGGMYMKSTVTSEPICGPTHVLEDGISVMSKNEALQWMLCCAFTPLASGVKMLPL